ncbi:hypothetical protein C8N24_5435 [Solirubrobacter pauli]|uniref:Uncharacterized protein n=1 Tax=Solirubrobacter pauli TaxID=166793 RepID=A0A660L2H4_9ACTN|nr:hypothetical protein [Solirubrobacter pauli]RKQ87414.1 hypothetical protein C8N24_5435 [Solirubrobacter pauli]
MNPFKVIDAFAAELDRAGIPFERGTFEGSATLSGHSADHERLLEAFCAVAGAPVDREIEVEGEPWVLPDHQDADLLLHESGVEAVYGQGDTEVFVVSFRRQFSFEDPDEEYLGMHLFGLDLQTGGVPAGRVPQAQRWGYGGPPRADTSDEEHAEIAAWAGHVEPWAAAVRASNSWKALDAVPVVRFSALQSDI